MEDIIKKNGFTLYSTKCERCSKDRGYLQKRNSLIKLCKSCASKDKLTKHGNPMKGKKHLNKEKFRKITHTNVDYDSLKVLVLPSGFPKKVYRQTCPQCSIDVGYRPIIDAKRTCRTCRIKNRTKYSEDQKRIRVSIKANLGYRLRLRKINKEVGTTEMLPFELEDFFSYIESKFQEGMNWGNYGEWEIDHVIPDSWFNYSSIDDEEFKKSWALDNLQPMWKKENASKSNRYSGFFDPTYKIKDEEETI